MPEHTPKLTFESFNDFVAEEMHRLIRHAVGLNFPCLQANHSAIDGAQEQGFRYPHLNCLGNGHTDSQIGQVIRASCGKASLGASLQPLLGSVISLMRAASRMSLSDFNVKGSVTVASPLTRCEKSDYAVPMI
jgi:hypothetical protein